MQSPEPHVEPHSMPLIDAHCHPVLRGDVDRAAFERFLTESDRSPTPGTSHADTPLGWAVRRWCAPVLDLPPHADLSTYLRRRSALGPEIVRRRMLDAAGVSDLLLDTGIGTDRSTFVAPAEFIDADTGSPRVTDVVRLEAIAERLVADGVGADEFANAYVRALNDATADAVAVKSIIAYRHGFDVPTDRPGADEVRRATERWLRGGQARLTSPVVLRFLLWCGIDRGLPVQIHAGFGDPDLALAAADPALLQPWLAAVEPRGVPVVLLHCYPYHRQAGWLAAMYPHVYADVGLTLSHLGGRAPAVLAEFCELAPFHKLLYSSDAFGLPELYAVGALQFRWALERLMTTMRDDRAATAADLDRAARAIGAENARRVYRLS